MTASLSFCFIYPLLAGNALRFGFAIVVAPGEKIEKAHHLIRDLSVFTDKRLILIDKQGLTESEIE